MGEEHWPEEVDHIHVNNTKRKRNKVEIDHLHMEQDCYIYQLHLHVLTWTIGQTKSSTYRDVVIIIYYNKVK